MKKNIFSNRGFTLVEILVSMGLMVAGMTAMMKVSDIQQKSNIKTQAYAEADQLITEAHLLLNSEEACRNSIIGAAGASISSRADIENNVNILVDKDGNQAFRTGTDYTKGRFFRINNIRRVNFAGYPNWVNGQEYAFLIAFDLVPRQNFLEVGMLTKTLPEPIYLDVDVAGNAKECLTAMGRMQAEMRKETCENIGGIYGVDPADRNIWCTLPGDAAANVPFDPNGNGDNEDDGISSSETYLDDLNTVPYIKYIRRTFPGNIQTIATGGIEFTGLSNSGAGSISINNIGIYASQTDTDFENAVPTHQWLSNSSNFREMLRHETNVGYCNEAAGNMVLIRGDGTAICAPMSTMTCGTAPNGSPEYLRGINNNGEALCVPLIGGNTNCPNGGVLATDASSSLVFTCSSTCTPSGNWVPYGSSSCLCDSTTYALQRCDTDCGGTCSGGAQDGDIRQNPAAGSCTAPAYCGGGSVSSGPEPDASGTGSSCGYSCSGGVSRFRDLCNCCPSNYPNTGTNFGCCENAANTQVCL